MTFDADRALSALETYLRPTETRFTRWTLEGGRALAVVACAGSPRPGLTTFVGFDALRHAWPGVRAPYRLVPLMVSRDASDPKGDAGFHVAHALDWCLTKNVPPREREIVLTLGHSPDLPHLRWDQPLPWSPEPIDAGAIRIVPVLGYSVGDAEARLQHARGAEALEAWLERARVEVFDRRRAPTTPS